MARLAAGGAPAGARRAATAAGGGWGVLALELSAEERSQNQTESDQMRATVDEVYKYLDDPRYALSVWPQPGGPKYEARTRASARAANADPDPDDELSVHMPWRDLWRTIKRSTAKILLVFSDGVFNGNFYFRGSGSDLYSVNEFTFANAIVDKFSSDQAFQLMIFAGAGTERLGAIIDAAFRRRPSLPPPSVICWASCSAPPTERNHFLKPICKFTRKFLVGMLVSRNPAIQKDVDLRGTIHTFVNLKRQADGKASANAIAVRFFPSSQIDFIEHIYYRLGMCAFELGRRLSQIIDHGLLFTFKADEEKAAYARMSTVYLFADLFAWLFVLRQQPAQLYYQDLIRGLEYTFSGQDVSASALKSMMQDWHLGDVVTLDFRLLKFDLRAMGEVMAIFPKNEGERMRVLTWVEFCERWNDKTSDFKSHFHKLEEQLDNLLNATDPDLEVLRKPLRSRMVWIHNQLCKIVEHYTKELQQQASTAKITPICTTAEESYALKQLARQGSSDEAAGRQHDSGSKLARLFLPVASRGLEVISASHGMVCQALTQHPEAVGLAIGAVLSLLFRFSNKLGSV